MSQVNRIHPQACCEAKIEAAGVVIDAFAYVHRGAALGQRVRIGSHATVGNGAQIGSGVTIGALARIGGGVHVEMDVSIGAGADLDGRSESSGTLVRTGAVIDPGALILPGVTIGQKSRISAGAVVTKSVPPNAIVAGNPAQIVGYVDALGSASQVGSIDGIGSCSTSVRGVTLHSMRDVVDLRGNLTVGEIGPDIPFEVKRYFLVHGVPSVEVRGEHAHRRCHQFLIAVHGSVHVVADDGVARAEFVLDRPSLGLYLPPLTWGVQYKYTADAVLLVLASHHYEADDYIRDHDQFLALVAQGGDREP